MRVVVVHGVEIPEKLLAQEAQNHPSLSAADARTAAGHALATKALLLRRSHELGLVADPELDDDCREETAEAALVRAVLEAEVEVTSPTDAECRRVYDAHREQFRSPAMYEAAHILIEPRSAASPDVEDACWCARRLIEVLARGVCTFAELARDHSDCPSGATGGSLGRLRPGDLVSEVESALLELEPGQVAAAPVRSRFGWHVLKLDRRFESRDCAFEVAAEHIRLHLESRAWDVAASRYVVALADAAREKGLAFALGEDGSVSEGSSCLGDFLADGMAAARLSAWLELADPALQARLHDAALAGNVEPLAFVRAATAAFIGQADDEGWTQLLSAAQGAEDPALAALAAILKSKLAPPQRAAITVIEKRAAARTRSSVAAGPTPIP